MDSHCHKRLKEQQKYKDLKFLSRATNTIAIVKIEHASPFLIPLVAYEKVEKAPRKIRNPP